MDDGKDDDIASLWAAMVRPASSVAERRKTEARGMPGRKRAAGRVLKTAQLNIKITPTLKRQLSGVAKVRGVSVAELVETAFNHYRGNGGQHGVD
jgi:predicted HicB family RNase H-like nuclease